MGVDAAGLCRECPSGPGWLCMECPLGASGALECTPQGACVGWGANDGKTLIWNETTRACEEVSAMRCLEVSSFVNWTQTASCPLLASSSLFWPVLAWPGLAPPFSSAAASSLIPVTLLALRCPLRLQAILSPTCSTGCRACTDADTCLACNDGYALMGSACQQSRHLLRGRRFGCPAPQPGGEPHLALLEEPACRGCPATLSAY